MAFAHTAKMAVLGVVWAALVGVGAPVLADDALEVRGPKEKQQTQTLEALKKILTPESITVWEPHEKKEVTYVGFRAAALFDALTNKEWRKIEDVVLTCLDGYQAVVPTERFSKYDAFLAFERTGQPEFRVTNSLQGNEVVPLGPYYLVWDNREKPDLKAEGGHGWPYQVKMVSFFSAEERFPKMAPPKGSPPPVKRGFAAYQKNCFTCHAVNGDGGNKSIDLVVPFSPVEYWKEPWLKRWIVNAAELRPGTTMPALSLQGKEGERVASDIIAYLKAMVRARGAKK